VPHVGEVSLALLGGRDGDAVLAGQPGRRIEDVDVIASTVLEGHHLVRIEHAH
jgi:hypothetical protein